MFGRVLLLVFLLALILFIPELPRFCHRAVGHFSFHFFGFRSFNFFFFSADFSIVVNRHCPSLCVLRIVLDNLL